MQHSFTHQFTVESYSEILVVVSAHEIGLEPLGGSSTNICLNDMRRELGKSKWSCQPVSSPSQ